MIFIINSLEENPGSDPFQRPTFGRTLERHLRNPLTFALTPSRIHSSSGLWLEFQAFERDKSLKLSNFAVGQCIYYLTVLICGNLQRDNASKAGLGRSIAG
jgi:hypothetical protein